MLTEACFVWNHALALQKRYYRLYGKYVTRFSMMHHFKKRVKRTYLSAKCTQSIIDRLDKGYKRFFSHLSQRPPKFKKKFRSIDFQKATNGKIDIIDSCKINNNAIIIKTNKKRINFKYHKSRNIDNIITRISLVHNLLGEYFICLVLGKETEKYGKTHNGASVGIDFGLKTYLTLSDGTRYDNPLFMKESLTDLRRRSRNLSKCKKGSNNRERKRKELDRLWNDICNKRDDFQWKLAHNLCRKYDYIFIEDLNLADMNLGRRVNRKLKDQAHGEFVLKLQYIASKYGVVVHKIDRYYPSSKTCTCGYVNKELKLTDRQWTCPHCGMVYDRDLLAANNILRRGIYELESDSKSSKHSTERQSRNHPTITRQTA